MSFSPFITRALFDASRAAAGDRCGLSCRRICFFAVLAFLFVLSPSAARASCGKGYVVLPPGHAGAVVSAIVTKHRQAYAEQTHSSRTHVPTCSGPGCRDNAPASHEAPLVRTATKVKIDATLGVVRELRVRAVGALIRDPASAIYFFEASPPPTPPPDFFTASAS